MAMAAGSGGDVNSEINVTPMIDVLLVLLIIFMLVQALSRTAHDLTIPPIESTTAQSDQSDQIVLELRDDGSNWLNNQGPYTFETLEGVLHETFDGRPAKLLFLKPGKTRKYRELIQAVDVGRGAGIQVFGLTPIEAY